MNHTLGRHRRLYKLLNDTGCYKYRHHVISGFTNGRTEDSAQLTDLEADELIRQLEGMVTSGRPDHTTRSGVDYQGQKQRRRILSLCYTIGWTVWDPKGGKHVVDFDRLNAWMLKYGYLHKGLNQYNHQELQILVKQFEKMASAALTEKRI